MKNEMIKTDKGNGRGISLSSAKNEMRGLLNQFWNMFDFPKTHDGASEPKIEVSNTKDAVVVYAEMPGIAEDDMDIELSSDGYLTISGEKQKHISEKCDNGCFSEVYYGKVSRTIPLPWDLDYNQADAEYNNGVLSVSIPKSPKEKQKFKKLNVKKNK